MLNWHLRDPDDNSQATNDKQMSEAKTSRRPLTRFAKCCPHKGETACSRHNMFSENQEIEAFENERNHYAMRLITSLLGRTPTRTRLLAPFPYR